MTNHEKQIKYANMFGAGSRVLELGSGGGDFLRACRQCGIDAQGVDMDPKSEPEFKVTKSDIMAFLKKNKRRFSGIYARHVIEHFEPSDLEMLFKLVSENLEKNGRFIFIFPNMKNIHVLMNEFWKDITHKRPYVIEALQPLIERSGFTLIQHGQDKQSRDNSIIKTAVRALRKMLTGIPDESPDYFAVAVKK